VYLGVFYGGEVTFEPAIGKSVAILQTGSEGTMPLPVSVWNDIRAMGKTVFTFWDPAAEGNLTGGSQDVLNGYWDDQIIAYAQAVKDFGDPLFWAYPSEPNLSTWS
jgi:hypothetical protein